MTIAVTLRALDLFCGAGGASMGLHRAGYEVTGVNINPQPNYPFRFIQKDAFLWLETPGAPEVYDLIWASPPCQAFTAYKRRPGHVEPCADVIPLTREYLQAVKTPWIMENVEGSTLRNHCMLCGSMFGLDVRRHRLFETSFPVLTPQCSHELQRGSYPQATNRANRRKTVEVGVWRIPLDMQQRAMGVDWMTREELSQAVPPAYSEFLGEMARSSHFPSAAG